MITLRIEQLSGLRDGAQRVRVDLDEDGVISSSETELHFELDERDRVELRWYLEDYLEYPVDPAPAIAKRVEGRIVEMGTALFHAVFPPGSEARETWALVRDKLAQARVEVITDVDHATQVPWELLRDPRTDSPVALRARSFVRGYHRAAQRPKLTQASGPIRILLVICRPGRDDDVPFRSVASQLIRLYPTAPQQFSIEVLRPATFASLGRVLRAAAERDMPYHVVHFDGHGTYDLLPGENRRRGYLLFEDAEEADNIEEVDGSRLGKLLAETRVALLVLNACRSAHSGIAARPEDLEGEGHEDPHARVRAYGSLAQEVMDAGVAGVVAMSYNVYVVTAAQFVAELYQTLLEGHDLGQAVTRSRKNLADDPGRQIAFDSIALQDWPVPIVFEAAPLRLFPPPAAGVRLPSILDPGSDPETQPPMPALNLPPTPDVGFYGRDETLLALDRAFDVNSIVLLHAYAGNGKTATAAEFARWYQLTGGLSDVRIGTGPVVFLSFEHHRPMAAVLNDVFDGLRPHIGASGDKWMAADTAQRRTALLEILRQIPALLIWDNVEPINGFPDGAESAWSAEEIRELTDLLRDLAGTRAKVLLTSRRTEEGLLGGLPTRLQLPPMPMSDRFQLARAIAIRLGHRLNDIVDWRPLLRFTAGNPLTVTVLVGEALRSGISTKEQVEFFVEELQAGAKEIGDDVEQGRAKSLGASLSYGFAKAFNDDERRILALLALFQNSIMAEHLAKLTAAIARSAQADGIPTDISEVGPEQADALLRRAGEIGLLSQTPFGYAMHPALPWYFRREFTLAFGPADSTLAMQVTRAFVETMCTASNYFADRYQTGQSSAVAWLANDESNLIAARRIAMEHGWWSEAMDLLRGIQTVYEHTGRDAELKRLLTEMTPHITDPVTGLPASPEFEAGWLALTAMRQREARRRQDWKLAEHLMELSVKVSTSRAEEALAKPSEMRTPEERNRIRSKAVDDANLGLVLLHERKQEAVPHLLNALNLFVEIGGRVEAGASAANLANAYMGISEILDLDQAEVHLRQAFVLYEGDDLGQGKCACQLGQLGRLRIEAGLKAGASEDTLNQQFRMAMEWIKTSFELLPKDAIRELAISYEARGLLIAKTSSTDEALRNLNEAIRLVEQIGARHDAARLRVVVAYMLADAGRLDDAVAFADQAARELDKLGSQLAASAHHLADSIRAYRAQENP